MCILCFLRLFCVPISVYQTRVLIEYVIPHWHSIPSPESPPTPLHPYGQACSISLLASGNILLASTLASYPAPWHLSLHAAIWKCYQVQACSARWTRGQWIWEKRCRGKEDNLIHKATDGEDGKWMSQNNLSGPGCQVFLWIRDRRRWGNQVKRPLILQIPPRTVSLRQGVCVNFFFPAIYMWTVFLTKAP